METRKARVGLVAMLVLCGVLAYALTAPGGSLEPSRPPGPTMRTLNEIYGTVDSVDSMARATMQTLNEIYGTVDSMARGGLTYPEKFWIEQLFDVAGGRIGPWLWLHIDGNDIEGECTIASMEREGTIVCWGFDHEVSVPYDAATLQITGARVHSPISIIKRTDKSSPLLLKALCLDEPVDFARFMFTRPAINGSGAEEHHLTILLEDAKIVAIRNAYPNLERVTFLSRKITWTYLIGGVEFQDIIRPNP